MYGPFFLPALIDLKDEGLHAGFASSPFDAK